MLKLVLNLYSSSFCNTNGLLGNQLSSKTPLVSEMSESKGPDHHSEMLIRGTPTDPRARGNHLNTYQWAVSSRSRLCDLGTLPPTTTDQLLLFPAHLASPSLRQLIVETYVLGWIPVSTKECCYLCNISHQKQLINKRTTLSQVLL